MNSIKQHFEEAQAVLAAFLSDEHNFSQIEKAGQIMSEAVKRGNKIISCGNGGSMCDAMHFAEELSGLFMKLPLCLSTPLSIWFLKAR